MTESSDQIKKVRSTAFLYFGGVTGNRLWCRVFLISVILLISGLSTALQAQVVEDSTQTERELPETPHTETYNNFLRVPYQSSFDETNLNRYSLYGVDGKYTFHKRLGFSTVEDFMMGEEERYKPYDAEWVDGINMRLAAILHETFKEQNSFLQKLARIVPFLGLGFFEEYEVPIVPRQEYFYPEPQIPEN